MLVRIGTFEQLAGFALSPKSQAPNAVALFFALSSYSSAQSCNWQLASPFSCPLEVVLLLFCVTAVGRGGTPRNPLALGPSFAVGADLCAILTHQAFSAVSGTSAFALESLVCTIVGPIGVAVTQRRPNFARCSHDSTVLLVKMTFIGEQCTLVRLTALPGVLGSYRRRPDYGLCASSCVSLFRLQQR